MSSKQKIVILGFFISILLLLIYILIRPGMLEEKYVAGLNVRADRIASLMRDFEKNKNLQDRDLARFQKLVSGEFGPITFLALADRNNRVMNRERLKTSSEFIDSVIYSFEQNRLQPGPEKPYFARYFDKRKHYIFIKGLPDGQILLVFPFVLTRNLIIQFTLEVILILLIALMITTAIYLLLYRTGRIQGTEEGKIVDIGRRERAVPKSGEKISREVTNLAAEALRDYVFDLFRTLELSYDPEVLALYLANRDSVKMEKRFELKGKVFLKIEANDFDVLQLDNEIGRELKKGSTLILDGSRRVMIPILYRNALLGCINLYRSAGLTGPEVNEIKAQLEKIAPFMSEFIFLHDVVVNKETGLYGKPYFHLKYNEQKKLHIKNGTDFSVLLISPLKREMELTQEQQNSLSKTIAGKILEHLQADDIVCQYDDLFAVLMPQKDLNTAVTRGEVIRDALLSLKIRIEKGFTLELQPSMGAASAAGMEGRGDTLEAAEEYMSYARTLEGSQIHYASIRTI